MQRIHEYDDTPLGVYRHYKGNLYRLLSIGRHSETLEPMAVYEALYGEGGIWVRPMSMWSEPITVGDTVQPRFAYIGEDAP